MTEKKMIFSFNLMLVGMVKDLKSVLYGAAILNGQ